MIEIVEYISGRYEGKVVEVGIGHFFAISDRLEEIGFDVTRVDLKKTRDDVTVDDVCNPDYRLYRDARLIISVRPPIDIQRCIVELGRVTGCDVLIIPLKNEILDGGKLMNFRGVSFYLFTPQS